MHQDMEDMVEENHAHIPRIYNVLEMEPVDRMREILM